MASSSTAVSSNINSGYFYGWDLLYRTIESEVNKKSDLLIALAHFALTKHFNFRCIGIGEDKTLSDDEVGSELLPQNWNENDTKYALRYVCDKNIYLLLGVIAGDTLLINLLDVTSKKVSNVCLEVEKLVLATEGNINKMMPTASEIVNRYRQELIDPVFTGVKREADTQTAAPKESASSRSSLDDPLRIGPIRYPGQNHPAFEPFPFGPPEPGRNRQPPLNPFGVGRGDLDPLNGGGSGNLLPFPPRPGMPGSGQPRFDPFNPPRVPGEPDPDHARPPNWGGDYYM